ncbi:MAG: ATP-binding protein [Dehalococcoidia bacterium]|nr:ATP-binding protein [Dehalococcoidia bacterium]
MGQLPDYEKLGLFYLGRPYDTATAEAAGDLLLYKSKHLTTHAVCVGMTGSGKTGLCIGLLEEAAMDGIPAIIIDPKGDMTNLMLTFPQLRAEDFLPWVNEDDARRKGISVEEFAQGEAKLWTEGLATWGQDSQRIQRLRDNAEFFVYTPGSSAGLPVSILKTLDAPAPAIMEDLELLGDRISTTVTSLLGLMGIKGDPVRSREHILLSHLLTNAWEQGQDMDLGTLIQQIQSPPIERIGFMTIESFFPAGDRFELALALNNLLAAPGFGQWLEGEPLDIGAMLYAPSGKPRMAIVSIAHLSDEERMFFVSLLLNEVVGWVRSQPGTTSLRAILYMDEIYGYFPPVANPPSKKPLLTLLKQARAHGLGVVLTTQNPVDLDYKGLANTGTWFIGRLQTERDKARVIEGLEGVATESGTGFNRAETERLIAGLGNRVFLLNNVHEDVPEVFQTRWAMSYLRGPLTRTQIKQLMEGRPQQKTGVSTPTGPSVALPPRVGHTPSAPIASKISARPVLPPSVPEYFVPTRGLPPQGHHLLYEPVVLGAAHIGFADRKTGARLDKELTVTTDATEDAFSLDWSQAGEAAITIDDLEKDPATGGVYSPVPTAASSAKSYTTWKRDLVTWLYGTQTLELLTCTEFKQTSVPGESERDFRMRLTQLARERRDSEMEKLRDKYEKKVGSLRDKILVAEQAVEREQDQAKQQKMSTAISFGAGLLGGVLGGRMSSMGRVATGMKGMGRTKQATRDVERAKEKLDVAKAKLKQIEEDFREDTERVASAFDPSIADLDRVTIRPMKKDIRVRMVTLAWLPHWASDTGYDVRPAY